MEILIKNIFIYDTKLCLDSCCKWCHVDDLELDSSIYTLLQIAN